MKKKNLLQKFLIMLFLSALVFGCENPNSTTVDTPAVDTPAVDTPAVDTPAVDTPAVDTPAVVTPAVVTPAADTAKLNFESELVGDNYYFGNTVDAADAAIDGSPLAVRSDEQAKAGVYSLKLTGTSQIIQYTGGNIGFASRLKVLEILNVAALDLVGKAFSVNYYIPTGATNTTVTMSLKDAGYQESTSNATALTAGAWTTVYYKVLAASDHDSDATTAEVVTIIEVESDGTTLKAGNGYTADAFDASTFNELEIRSLNATAGVDITLYVDTIDWE